ncbi:MAG: hypothetical protein WAO52_15690 [Prolixibacteraceae bacterium]
MKNFFRTELYGIISGNRIPLFRPKKEFLFGDPHLTDDFFTHFATPSSFAPG